MTSQRAARIAGPTLAAMWFVVGVGGAALAEEASNGVTVLRGAPPRPTQPQNTQQVQVMRPQIPTCPEGYYFSFMNGYCYQFRDPTRTGEFR